MLYAFVTTPGSRQLYNYLKLGADSPFRDPELKFMCMARAGMYPCNIIQTLGGFSYEFCVYAEDVLICAFF